ncbi:MAG: DNA glycosylase AlkZ-like family protein, partial [Miltoncostaeaceae bacterium]
FGPVTEGDVRWWTGLGARPVRAALQEIEAVVVDLEGGREGYVAAGDLRREESAEGVVAMLPGLDLTAMGWRDRDWYLGPHREALFDRNGNVGPTIWCDGRIVGGWGQREDASIAHRLLEDPGREASERIVEQADALAAWLDGTRVTPRFRTPLERELAAG